MTKEKSWRRIVVLGATVLVLSSGTALVLAPTAEAAVLTPSQTAQGPGGWGGPRGGLGRSAGTVDERALLAGALGITEDELQSAFDAVNEAVVAQMVEEGLITQEQADRMVLWGGFGLRGGRGGLNRGSIDAEALLASELGITVDELAEAREEAHDVAVQQAIEEGLITQEQADDMEAHRQLHSYLDQGALLAEALGISVDELADLRADGKSLSTLIDELALDMATVRENLESAREAAVQEAVDDGVITQDQADHFLSGQGRPMGGPGGMRGGHGFPGSDGAGRLQDSGLRPAPRAFASSDSL